MSRPRSIVAVFACGALGFASAAFAARAAAKPKPIQYVPPTGLFGHVWGEPRSTFDRLPSEPLGVGAAWMAPVLTALNCDSGGGGGYCDLNSLLLNLWQKREGGGFYVVSEYSIDTQAVRYAADDPFELYPVVYQFCANWRETKKVKPPDFDEINKFCGVKLLFSSETREQLRTLPANYLTNYDRVLDRLLEKYGRPEGFRRRGQVQIETLEGEVGDAAKRQFKIWRWCPAHGVGLHTTCAASIVLSFDIDRGVGTVLYSTPVLWEFAYARWSNGFRKDRLFKLLHAR